MFNSLYSKIAVGLALIFLLMGLFFIWLTEFATEMYQQEATQKLNSDLARQIVTQRNLLEEGHINHEALAGIFRMLMVINPSIELYLLDPKGKILTFSAPPGSLRRDQVDMSPIFQLLNNAAPLPIRGDDPRAVKARKIFSVAPIYRDKKLEGYLYVILGGKAHDSIKERLKGSYILQLSSWMMGTGLLFGLVAGLLLFSLLTRRLKRLARTMVNFKPGDTLPKSKPAQKKTFPDEIDHLTTSFEAMAARIHSQMESLRESDQIRRELMANVSHDLRTPLATLQGYIETLLIKDEQTPPKERKKYLEIGIQHCHRLNRLVNDLLELAKLESAQITLSAEPFCLAELVQDVGENFMLMAKERQIKLMTRLDRELPRTLADIGLVERVLENLIENAVSHTPAGGRVTLTVRLEEELCMEISDTGPGIPEADQDRIFDRFYHGRNVGNIHSGLGLAISQKIIQLHGRRIELKSSPGMGSRFFFTLPLADPKP
ncbi:MAG: HAMP domain-containing histidine kinase [Desulfobacterales bacterium]|nr:HAMP domain-containing histidine kinase [Desulfobacterales bacterium]